MSILHDKILEQLASSLKTTLDTKFSGHGLTIHNIYALITSPPNSELGHFAFPCFPLAKSCRRAPAQIATEVANSLEKTKVIKEVSSAGPYVNFKLNISTVGELVLNSILDNTYFEQKLIEVPKKVMIEYSQPNTHKVLHVGHMRNLCLGNFVVNIHRYCAHEVISATYPGDVGTHVAKCLWYLKYHCTDQAPTQNKGAWLGKLYAKGNQKLEDELGTPNEEKNRQLLTAILKQLEAKEGEFYDLWKETRSWSLELMNQAYAWTNVSFDKWFYESEVDSPSLELAKKYYSEGVFIQSQGAIGMDLSDDKLGFCLYIKSDGTGLYATKDLELARKKFEEFGIEKNIYVVDNRQSLHFKQVFKTLEKVGFEQSKDCYHLSYEMVELPDGPMSSRKGNIVPLMELVSNMEKTIKENFLSKYQDQWSEEEINQTASMVAGGAIKYGMTRVDNNRKIVFDMNEWLKLDGETGPYLQYVYARIRSLAEKLVDAQTNTPDWSLLKKSQEEALVIKLTHFNKHVLQSLEQYKPMVICSYLYELGKLFNSFYAECPIANAESGELRSTRLALAIATGKVMKKGLGLLGISAPKRM